MNGKAGSCALVLLLAALHAASGHAYVLLSPARCWISAPRAVTVDFRGVPSVSAPDPDQGVTAAVNAANAWNSGGVNPVSTQAGSVAYVLGDDRSDVIFGDPLGICTGSCLAATTTGYYNSGQTTTCNGTTLSAITDADIAFNLSYDYTTVAENGCSGEISLEAVVTHEIGHLIGLGHSTLSAAIMYPSVSYCDNKQLNSDDLAGRDALYACVPVSTSPDLVVSALSAPSSAAPGQAVVVNDTTSNPGTGGAGASQSGFYLSTDATLGSGDVALGSRSVGGLAAGAGSSAATTLTIPSGTAPGAYYLIAAADAAGVVAESSEGNNQRSAPISISASSRPDLLLTKFTSPMLCAAGRAVSLSSAVKNAGTATAAASTLRFYLSLDPTYQAGDFALGQRSIPQLLPGASSSANTSIIIPSWTWVGGFYLLARADDGGTVAESNEANNLAATIIVVGPDLIVSSLTPPAAATPGARIRVYDVTTNQGGGPATASSTRLYLSRDAVLDGSDVLLGGRNLSSLGGSSSSSSSVYVNVPATAPGPYYIVAMADAAAQVTELTETNNVIARPITIGQAPGVGSASVSGGGTPGR